MLDKSIETTQFLVMLKNKMKSPSNLALELGLSIRIRRKELKLTMQKVADAARLSVGFISQVERKLSSLSLASLAGLSEILEVSVGTFLSQPDAGDMTCGSRRVFYSVPGAGASYERVSNTCRDIKPTLCDPEMRNRDDAAFDSQNGFVSPERAEDVYRFHRRNHK
jgi:transcriptional regulator with XRE-family HTH domain